MTPHRPSPEDLAAQRIIRECAARGHEFPETEPLRPTETEIGPGGRRLNHQRTPCPGCGTVQVFTWEEPASTAGSVAFIALGTYEEPDPGDVPHLAEHLDAGARPGLPAEAPVMADEAPLQRTVRVLARQFYLLDQGETPASIIPVPAEAITTGTIDTVPGAAVIWTGPGQTEVHLTIVVSRTDPEPELDAYEDIVELTYRSTTGHVVITELAGGAHALPPLPGGHGDHRVRHHIRGADTTTAHHLLQIWRAPRTRPLALKTTSRWTTRRTRLPTPPPPRSIPIPPSLPT